MQVIYKFYRMFFLMVLIAGFSVAQTAKVQVIHNASDKAAEKVDVYLNADLLLDDFEFRKATPFVDVPANEVITISIQLPNSTDTTGALAKFNYNLAEGGNYIILANGIVSSSGYDPVKSFNLEVYDKARTASTNANNTDVLVFHGSTDAPTVDVVETLVGAGTIVNNLSYAGFADYLELTTDDYRLAITDETGTTTVVSYEAPLQTLGLNGSALVVFASGFLNPANNSDGQSFGLWVALPDGTTLPLPTTITSVKGIDNSIPSDFSLEQNYPNPFNPTTSINFSMPVSGFVSLRIYNAIGQEVAELVNDFMEAGSYSYNINASQLSSGIYFYKLNSGNFSSVKKMMLIK